MRTLILPIKKVWFDKIKSGEKKEEYRDLTPYYLRRLFWSGSYEFTDYIADKIIQDFKTKKYDEVLKEWDLIVKIDAIKLRNGYTGKSPNFLTELKSVKVDTGRVEWGAEKDRLYFCLQLEKIQDNGSTRKTDIFRRGGSDTF